MRGGNVFFSSYRDPNLKKTDEIYDKMPEYIRNFCADERDMTKYIIGTVSELDTPLNPAAKGMRSLTAHLMQVDFEDVQRERDEIIGATKEDIQKTADLIAAVLAQRNFCVIGNEEKIMDHKDMFYETRQLL